MQRFNAIADRSQHAFDLMIFSLSKRQMDLRFADPFAGTPTLAERLLAFALAAYDATH